MSTVKTLFYGNSDHLPTWGQSLTLRLSICFSLVRVARVAVTVIVQFKTIMYNRTT